MAWNDTKQKMMQALIVLQNKGELSEEGKRKLSFLIQDREEYKASGKAHILSTKASNRHKQGKYKHARCKKFDKDYAGRK